ncbi:hypothetical protein [Devosia sp. A449]
MDRLRRRLAIGIFDNIGAVETIMAQLGALGITGCECFELTDDAALAEPGSIALDDVALRAERHLVLRIYLDTLADEQRVAKILLDSPALSVQLHDINPPIPILH